MATTGSGTAGPLTTAVPSPGLPPAGDAAVRHARGPRATVDPERPVAVFDEEEIASPGRTVATRVLILAGAECRYTCAMCDLWRHSLDGPTPPGSLPAQIRRGLSTGGITTAATEPRWIKLYNGSNFFDPRSVPPADLPAIAELLAGHDRVIVENHPRLTGPAVPRFRDRLSGRLEVALGLETVDPRLLPWLGKQMTADDFAAAAARLRSWDVDVRAFVLLGLPGLTAAESLAACLAAVAFAADSGARHVSIIPTRKGNGFMDDLARNGFFTPPSATLVEQAAAAAIGGPAAHGAIITIDLWDFATLAGQCAACGPSRRARLAAANLAQRPPDVSRFTDCVCGP
jgi:radical SAM enzyme (TIGR01210 family)